MHSCCVCCSLTQPVLVYRTYADFHAFLLLHNIRMMTAVIAGQSLPGEFCNLNRLMRSATAGVCSPLAARSAAASHFTHSLCLYHCHECPFSRCGSAAEVQLEAGQRVRDAINSRKRPSRRTPSLLLALDATVMISQTSVYCMTVSKIVAAQVHSWTSLVTRYADSSLRAILANIRV
jgi:hypothetical protein